MTDDNITFAPTPRYSYDNLSIIFLTSDPAERDAFLRKMRDALLAEVDALERALEISPTTADIRKWHRGQSGK